MSDKFLGDPVVLTINAGSWYTNMSSSFTSEYVDLTNGVATLISVPFNEFTPGVYSQDLPNLQIGNWNIIVKNTDVFATPYVQPLSIISPSASTGGSAGSSAQLSAINATLLLKADKTDIQGLSTQVQNLAVDTTFIRDMTAGRWQLIGSQMVFYAEDNITVVASFALKDINGFLTNDPNTAIERVRL